MNYKKVRLKRSNVINDDKTPKLPTSANMEYGELAINYASGVECISTKNASGEIITFKEDVHIGEESDAAISALMPNLFYDTSNNLLKYKDSNYNVYRSMPPQPTVTSTKTYSSSGSIKISQKTEEVILLKCRSGEYSFSVTNLPLNRIHLIVSVTNSGSVKINFPTDDESYITFGMDNLTVAYGDYGEISIIKIDDKYFIQSA
jgi:hypothetical protein